MDSMLDLEQLRLSIIEHDIPMSIGQVHQWIDSHGLALLRTNQRLPFNYEEAEDVRKQHEKVELKCMKFLAFYAKINLKDTPKEYEEMRSDMDITIHKFSEHIKARRHLVVSFFTLFRHIEELYDKFASFKNEDLSDLPDTIEEINALIGKFHKNINNCLKRLSHLKDEAERVKSSMDVIVHLNDSSTFDYVDREKLDESSSHIDRLLKKVELEVTRIFEQQRLLELQLKIEAKMMVIEEDIGRCCGWLERMEQRLVEKYNDKVVGMATVENDLLHQEAEELVGKMRMTKEYGSKLMLMYDQLCLQFKRDTSRGQTGGDKLNELWRLAELLSSEALGRLTTAGQLFHGLDTTLDKIEDMLLSINKDRENSASDEDIIDKYRLMREEVFQEFQDIKRRAQELLTKLRYDLYNKKLQFSNEGCFTAEQTEDVVKMKIFTIAVKLKELDRCIFQDLVPEIISQKTSYTYAEPLLPDADDDLDFQGNINKFLKFLNSTRLNWESRPLPQTLDQAAKALKEHQEVAGHSETYWKGVQTAFQSSPSSDKLGYQRLLSDADREKKNWDNKWSAHLDQQLNPRHQFFRKLKDFERGLNDDLRALDDLVEQPNHNLVQVKDVCKQLGKMRAQIPSKEAALETLSREGVSIHKTDFKSQLSAVGDDLECYRDRLGSFSELERVIEEILVFLPQLATFKKDWPSRVKLRRNSSTDTKDLRAEAEKMKAKIAKFDIGKLRQLADKTYGNCKRVEWLVDELRADFSVPTTTAVGRAGEEYIAQVEEKKKYQQMSNVDGRPPRGESSLKALLHSPTEMVFEMDRLPKVDQDQYNIQWYKNNVVIDPNRDLRMATSCEPNKGRAHMTIENCEYADTGKYWFELHDPSKGVLTSNMIALTVSPKTSSTSTNVCPMFEEKVFAGRNDPLTLELKLNGYRFAPESQLLRNNVPINVNQRECPWSRVSSNTTIEFSHPAIEDSDRGAYEFVVADKVEATTVIVVGDAPKLAHRHHFNEKVKLGDPVSITVPTVDIANKANQKVVWRKDDTHLSPDNGKFRSRLNDEGNPVFEIDQMKTVNAGVYTCEIFNEFGRTSAEMTLEVDENAGQSLFKSKVDKVCAKAGENVILDTLFSPAKNTRIDWVKDGEPVDTHDPRIQIVNDQLSRCFLQIYDSVVTDSGLYTASVRGTNREESTVLEIIPSKLAPVIEKYPRSLGLKLNEPVDIDCLVRSVPRCHNVKWTFHPLDGGPQKNVIADHRCRLTTSVVGDSSENLQRVLLYIDRASRSDAGDYVLRCENIGGFSSVKIPVSVVGADDGKDRKKAPGFVQALKGEVTTRGDEQVLLKCKTVGNPFPTVRWTKDGHDLTSSDFVKIRDIGELHELNILNPRASDSGTYEVIASNGLGQERSRCTVKVLAPQKKPVSEMTVPRHVAVNERNPGDFSDVEQIPQRTQLIFSNTIIRSPPQFVTTFTDAVVEEGEDVILKCCLVGQPEPVIWWSYNTHLLKNPRFEMSRQLDEYHLAMHNVREEDSGRYSMTAENSSGLATCSALVIVDKNHKQGKSIDRSQYKTNSKPMDRDSQRSPFPCHTTLSHSLNTSLPDESRVMQVSPRGWDDNRPKSSPNSPHHQFKPVDIEPPSDDNLDFSKSKTKTVKTYHYSGPSGIDLPGIGFIPKIRMSPTASLSLSSSSSSDDEINRAVFVPGPSKPPTKPKPKPKPKPVLNYTQDGTRFSIVESSECDYPL